MARLPEAEMHRPRYVVGPPAVREITVLDAGAKVLIGGDIRGYVTAVTVRGPYVAYEVVWFSECDRHEGWFAAHEVESIDPEPSLAIGFKVE